MVTNLEDGHIACVREAKVIFESDIVCKNVNFIHAHFSTVSKPKATESLRLWLCTPPRVT